MLKDVREKINLTDIKLMLEYKFEITNFDFESKIDKKPLYVFFETQKGLEVKLLFDFYDESNLSILIYSVKSILDIQEYIDEINNLKDIINSLTDYFKSKGFRVV